MLLLVIVLLIVSVVAIGLGLNWFLGTISQSDPKKGASVQNILVATELLAGLLLAIVVTDAGASYSAATTAAKQEADAVDNLYEAAEYVEMPFRQQLQADAVCYARAVIGPEWSTLAKGKRSPVPSNWTGTKPGALRATLLAMTPEATAFDLVQGADSLRGELRAERETQANPSIPIAVIWFVVVLLSLSLGGLAYSIPRAANTGQLVAMGVVVVTFLGAMALIYNLDRPFSGVLALEPSAMRAAEEDASEDYQDAFKVELPCDEEGNPRTVDGATTAGVVATTTTTSPTTTTPGRPR